MPPPPIDLIGERMTRLEKVPPSGRSFRAADSRQKARPAGASSAVVDYLGVGRIDPRLGTNLATSVDHPRDLPAALENPTSPTLIVSLQSGNDANVWPRVVRIYGPLIFRWCTRCGLQEPDAADVSQEVLASLPKSIRRFSRQDDHATFRGWLWTITRNKIADHCRRWSGAPAKGGTAALRLIERLPDQRPETSEDVAEVHLRALEGLQCQFNEKTWTAFWRVVVEGDAPRDVAEDLGTTVWTVYKARSRVLSRLRSELGGPVTADD